MGKSSSKLGSELLNKSNSAGHLNATSGGLGIGVGGANSSSANASAGGFQINEAELRSWCRNFNKDFPDAQLTDILDNEQLLAPFLTDIFYQEVEVSDCMQTLFRGNCLASKIMSHCFRTFGSKYLKKLLEPHISPLLHANAHASSSHSDLPLTKQNSAFTETTPSKRNSRVHSVDVINANDIENTAQPITFSNIRRNLTHQISNKDDRSNHQHHHPKVKTSISYEIDSARLEENGDIDVNQRNLLKLTKEILDSILLSAPEFPTQLNSMCICLRQVLCKKYPNLETNLKAVGTVIFLRFINPAIVSPYEAGIIDKQPTPRTMRGLMLVSKILQNIANNVEFSKEEHMLPFNDFVRTQFEPLRAWVAEISSERSQTDMTEIESNT